MKDVKKSERPSKDTNLTGFDGTEFFANRLSLPQELKDRITSEGMDWRFINASQFRQSGGYHASHWQPYKLTSGEFGSNAEGILVRGDLILAARPKAVSQKHREVLDRRNKAQQGINKQHAADLKKELRAAGAKVFEGYEDNE